MKVNRGFVDPALLATPSSFGNSELPKGDYAFEFAQYLGYASYMQELGNLQTAASQGTPFTGFNGQRITFDSLAGVSQANLYLLELESNRQALLGISKQGLDAQIKALSSRSSS